ncbi:TonB-dependent receptor [Cellvibrio sp. KY-GH-1]|uniref:TonB-dependent receptor n=1 Tax=Cellvibrio sp. KY-GH-1 TaxID=2303332 RepID=UPI001243D8B7|nr:TonB-dependent receptor [Cellvibrio sp. KY-GH-1]QEY18233.1 TonB-dependent receptor [Cellvibrio sp. KY-GH-1]
MFQKKTLSMAVAMVAAFGAVLPALAQQAAKEDQVEEVVVTGIRGSLQEALDVKREKTQIVDAIVAEDIGKFPDNNVIEALQRVTGVQVTNRGSGETSGISIRGLTDINTTVNGRNIFTASGLSVALQDVPASLIKQVDVYKTRSASQIENGIAGSVDIKTQRPFDFEGQKFVVAARAINQEQADKTDPNISGLASNRWETDAGEFGALVNLSYARTNYRDQSVTAGAMVPFATNNPVAPFTNYERIFLDKGGVAENPIWTPGLLDGLPDAPGSTLNVNGKPMEYILGRDAIFASDFTGERERTAANVSFQYAPNDSSEYLFEAFYNGYRNESFNSLLFSFADWWGEYASNASAANIKLHEGTNIVKSRSVLFPYMFTSGDLTTGQTDSYVYALGGSWDIGENLEVKSELVYQDSRYKSDFFAMRFDKVGYQIDVDFNSGGGLPAFGFQDNPATADVNESDLTDTVAWNTAQLYDNANNNDGDATTFTTDATLSTDLGIFKSFDFGVRIDQRTAAEAFVNQNGYNNSIAIEDMDGLAYINSGFFDGESNVPSTWAAANGYYIRSNAEEFRRIYGLSKQALVESFNIDELTTSAYVTGKFESELAGRTIDGEVGFRYTGSETDMEFARVSEASSDTSKVLPSVMVRYHWTDDLISRFAYTETLRRPNFAQLNSNIIYNEDVTNIGYGTAGGGNPDLKPTESQNYDLSLEWYFAEGSSLYGTLFQRDIEGFVIDFRRQVQAPKPDGSMGTYVLAQPFNASNGQLKGAEVGAVWFPQNLPWYLDGFGIQASYTSLESEQTTPITDSAGNITGSKNTSLFGVSDESYSVVLAYEKENIGARLSYAWRSKFLNNYEAALFANPLEVWRKPESSLDLQITYDVTDNISLTLDGTNLTEEIYQSYYGDNSTTGNFGSALYSRTIALGARFNF